MRSSLEKSAERASRITKGTLERSPAIVLTLSTIFSATASLVPENPWTLPILNWTIGQFGWSIAGLSFLLLIVGNIVSERRTGSLSNHEESISSILDLRDANKKSIEQCLKEALEYLELFGTEKSKKAVQMSRCTLYIHTESEKLNTPGKFIPVVRISEDPKLRKLGRLEYPDDEGVIGKVWSDTMGSFPRLPESESEWIRKATEDDRFPIPKETAKNITMKARSISGVRIEDRNGDPFSIIIFEHVRPHGVGLGTVENYRNLPESQTITTLMEIEYKLHNFAKKWSSIIPIVNERYNDVQSK